MSADLTKNADLTASERTCFRRLKWFCFLALALPMGAGAETNLAFDDDPGDLRLRATFVRGEAVVDLGPGEQRLSRMWGEPTAERPPWQKHRPGLIALEDCLVPGPGEGSFAFETRTDAALRGLGALNARSGTVAFRVRRSEVFDHGGMLLSGRSHLPGGPWGGIHWALGIGGRGSRVPNGRLFLETSAVRAVSEGPLPREGDWVHLAAVWDADMGVRLYADGRRVGDSWRDPSEPAESEERIVHSAMAAGPESLSGWLIQCRGDAEHGWVRVQDDLPWTDVRIAWDAHESALRIETERETRLQFLLPAFQGLQPGAYRMVFRYRQRNPGAEDGATSAGMNARLTLQEERDGRPEGDATPTAMTTRTEAQDVWQEISRVFVLGPHPKAGDAGGGPPEPDRFPNWPYVNAPWLLPASASAGFTGRFDVNITGPGVFELADLRIITADPGDLAVESNVPGLLPGYGRWMAPLLHDVVPVPVERIRLHRHGDGNALTDLHVFDVPLTASEIGRLAAGALLEPGMAPASENVRPDRARRFLVLGWGRDRDGDLPLLAANRTLTIREEWTDRAFEDLRAAGSIAVDGCPLTLSPWPYHGYPHTDPRKLHLKFAAPVDANYIVVRGNLSGELRAGGTRVDPLGGESVLALPGHPAVFRHRLAAPFRAESATILRTSGQVAGVHFYRIENGEAPGGGSRMYHLRGDPGTPVPLDEWKRQEFVTAYGPADRGYLAGRTGAGSRTEVRPLPALRAHHFFSEAADEDLPLSGIGLRLNLRGLAGSTRMHVRVNDGFDPWREWARLDVRLEPDDAGEAVYEVVLHLRETLLLAGRAAWVTVVLDRDAQLVYRPDGGESLMRLFEADPGIARRNFLEWELDGWRTAFERMSEPRPWGRGISDDKETGWWLRAASPEYEHMARVGRMLRDRFPGEPRVESWFAFIHPFMPDPSRDVELPDVEDHPRWAVLARAALGRYGEFVDWWTDHRHDGRGQLGSTVGDDTCLLQDWPDLALIDDVGGRYRDAVQRLSTAVVEWPRLNPREFRGRRYVENGLNSRWTDGLHAYEDGVNMQPMDFLLDYGNPVRFHRLLETAARYDGFLLTPSENGERRFNSDGSGRAFWNTDRPPAGSPYDRDFFPATHAGQMLMWYNGAPQVAEMFAEVAAWLIRSRAEVQPVGLERGGWYLMLALWRHFGDERYLAELIDLESAREEGVLKPPPAHYQPATALVRRLPAGLFDPDRTLSASREGAEERFAPSAPLGTNRMAGDRRYETCWFEWVLSGDKRFLEEGLEALYRRLTFTLPAVTVAEQSGDRVAVPKQLISLLYTGGVPAARNEQFYPMFAASYEGLGRNFAAMVLDDRDDLLRVLFYSFEEVPLRGSLRAWGIGPGMFEISGGPDRTGDDRIDEVEHRFETELVRGDGLEIELPPRRLYVWEVRRIRAGRPLRERPDLAVTGDDAQWHPDGSLTVRVHNIGSTAAPGVRMELRDSEERVLAARDLPPIEAPLDLRPRTVEVRFTADEVSGAAASGGRLAVWIDPDNTVEEITRRNNRARLPVMEP